MCSASGAFLLATPPLPSTTMPLAASPSSPGGASACSSGASSSASASASEHSSFAASQSHTHEMTHHSIHSHASHQAMAMAASARGQRQTSARVAAQQHAAQQQQQQVDGDDDADGDDDDGDDEAAGAATGDSKMKRGHGSSCHQCKTTKEAQFLFFCTNKAEKGVRKRRCRKKFCDSCLKRSYGHDTSEVVPGWQCPSCLGCCICAACHRKSSSKQKPGASTAASTTNSNAPSTANHTPASAPTPAPTSTTISPAVHGHSGASSPAGLSGEDGTAGLGLGGSRRSSTGSARISLSPLTISRGLSTDDASARVRAGLVSHSPRFGRSLTGGGSNNHSGRVSGAVAPLPPELDPFHTQSDELEKLMVGMNMAQRAAFLQDAQSALMHHSTTGSHTLKHPAASAAHLTDSPRASPRAHKRKLSSATPQLESPAQQPKLLQPRIKRELLDDVTLPPSAAASMPPLPPSHAPPRRAQLPLSLNMAPSSPSMVSSGGLLTPLGVGGLGVSGGLLNLSTPSAATHLPELPPLDAGLFSPGATLGAGAAVGGAGVPSSGQQAMMMQLSVSTPTGSTRLPLSSPGGAVKMEQATPVAKNETGVPPPESYLQWGAPVPAMGAHSAGTHGAVGHGSSSVGSMLGGLGLVSPMPGVHGSSLLSYPSFAPMTPGGALGLGGLGSPSPMSMRHMHELGSTPSSAMSSNTSGPSLGLLSPNPASSPTSCSVAGSSASPNPMFGSALVYPSSYVLPPAESSFAPFARQMSEGAGGLNSSANGLLLGDGSGLMERGLSAISVSGLGGGVGHAPSDSMDKQIDNLYSSDFMRQYSANNGNGNNGGATVMTH